MRTSYLPSLNCIAHKIQYISALYISIILATPLSRYSINICNYKNKIGWQYFFVAGTLSTNYHLEAELSFYGTVSVPVLTVCWWETALAGGTPYSPPSCDEWPWNGWDGSIYKWFISQEYFTGSPLLHMQILKY